MFMEKVLLLLKTFSLPKSDEEDVEKLKNWPAPGLDDTRLS